MTIKARLARLERERVTGPSYVALPVHWGETIAAAMARQPMTPGAAILIPIEERAPIEGATTH